MLQKLLVVWDAAAWGWEFQRVEGSIPLAHADGVTRSYRVMGTPLNADDGAQRVGILRLRMTSTSWA
jgi:hypothetical protein